MHRGRAPFQTDTHTDILCNTHTHNEANNAGQTHRQNGTYMGIREHKHTHTHLKISLLHVAISKGTLLHTSTACQKSSKLRVLATGLIDLLQDNLAYYSILKQPCLPHFFLLGVSAFVVPK